MNRIRMRILLKYNVQTSKIQSARLYSTMCTIRINTATIKGGGDLAHLKTHFDYPKYLEWAKSDQYSSF